MNTIEINKLFADFMGYEILLGGYVDIYPNIEIVESLPLLEWHFTDYNSLMQVVNKLQSVTEEPEELDDLKQSLWFNSIADLRTDLADAIQWYNKQKQ